MKKRKIKDAAWFPMAVAICIGVVLYILLSRFTGIWGGVKTFLGFFKTVIMGCVIAYLVNPLANLFLRLFKRIKKEKTRGLLSNSLAFLAVFISLVFSVAILVPQLVESIETFVGNLDGYVASANSMLESLGVSNRTVDISGLISSSEKILSDLSGFIYDNAGEIATAITSTGKGLFQWVIAFILSIYLLAEKKNLKEGFQRLLKAIFGEERYREVNGFLYKSNKICSRYIAYNLIDGLIVGCANAAFMTIAGMQYVGLISFAVALTNLVPTFGPMVGLVIGGFVLLIVNPVHALMFVIFTLILQLCDGYIIKPRLFGNSLGVSGLWILIGVIVGGNMFGVIGILLAVPCVAIMVLIYETYLLPGLEKRMGIKNSKTAGNENIVKEGQNGIERA